MTATLGEFEQLLLLAMVRLGKNAYGATLRQEIEKRTGRTVAIGAVYTALERLERKGYVGSKVGEPTPERGGRRKKYYRLEPLGAKALNRSYHDFKRMADGLGRKLEVL